MIMIKIIKHDNNPIRHRCLYRRRQSTIKNVFLRDNSLTEMMPPKLMITKIWFDLARRANLTYWKHINFRGQQVSFPYNKVLLALMIWLPNATIVIPREESSLLFFFRNQLNVLFFSRMLTSHVRENNERQMCVFYHAFFHVIVKHC